MTESIKRELAALVPRLRQFAYALCGDRDRGDDLVQTACVKGLSRLDHFEAGTRLDSWMFRIVQNTFLDEIRAQGRRGVQADPECLDRLSDHGAGAGQAEDRIVLARVRQKMAELPPEQRSILALVAVLGHSYGEAAEILSVPIGTIMSRLARARARLLSETGSGGGAASSSADRPAGFRRMAANS